MAARQHLFEEWQSRLAVWRQRLGENRPLRPWLAEVYVRVLSFMIARYAARDRADDGPQNDPPVGLPTSGGESKMSFRATALPAAGKPPRSAAEMRSTLDAVRLGQGGSAELGPLAGGLSGEDLIQLASFRNRADAHCLQKSLREAQIDSEATRAANRVQVLVPVRDLRRAKVVAERIAPMIESRANRRYASRSRFWARSGFACGFALGAVAAGIAEAVYSNLGPRPDWRLMVFSGGCAAGLLGLAIGITVGMIADASS